MARANSREEQFVTKPSIAMEQDISPVTSWQAPTICSSPSSTMVVHHPTAFTAPPAFPPMTSDGPHGPQEAYPSTGAPPQAHTTWSSPSPMALPCPTAYAAPAVPLGTRDGTHGPQEAYPLTGAVPKAPDQETSDGCSDRRLYGYLFGLVFAMTATALFLRVAASPANICRAPSPEIYVFWTCIIMSNVTGFVGIIVGLSCCHFCKRRNVLAAAMLLFVSAVSGVLAMSICSGDFTDPSVYRLGWFAVPVSSIAAILYRCAYEKKVTVPS